MVAVGVVPTLLLHGNLLIAALILLAMTFAAAVTASRRAPEIKNPLLVSFYAIAAGSSVVIAVLLATKTLTTDLVVLVPVGDHRQRHECLPSIILEMALCRSEAGSSLHVCQRRSRVAGIPLAGSRVICGLMPITASGSRVKRYLCPTAARMIAASIKAKLLPTHNRCPPPNG